MKDPFSAFADKLHRFTQANPAGEPAHTYTEDEILQIKVNDADEAFKLTVLDTYKKYRYPYKTLGEKSSDAAAIDSDKRELLAAYNLYKTIQDANVSLGTQYTFIKNDSVVCSLTEKDLYTYGDNFVYLCCWLRYENHVTDFFPTIARDQSGDYRLRFVPAKQFRLDSKSKEIDAIIRLCFYPGESAL
ncbi:MAG: hypothetical protein J1D88_03165 [Treponema sp.]|nr:hypothetical protein [Treponema sp.]